MNKTIVKENINKIFEIIFICFDKEIFDLLSLMLHKLHVYRISIHGLKKYKLLLRTD